MVMTEDKKEELSLRFKAMYEAEQTIETKNEEIKAFKAHIREIIKELANTLETKQKTVKAAYKEYINSVENPEEDADKNQIVAILQEFNLIGLSKDE